MKKLSLRQRVGLALRVLRSGGINSVIEHFRRVDGGSASGVTHPQQQIVSVFRCVQFIAEGAASMPLRVSTADDRVLEAGPIVDLIESPNATQSTEDFIAQTIGWLLLTGRVHWVFPDMLGDRPRQMIPIGAVQMQPRFEGQSVGRTIGKKLIGWRYRPAGHRWDEAIDLDTNQVWTMTVAGFDPDRPWEGLGVVDVVRKAIHQVYQADIANIATLENGVEPGGALRTKENLTDDQKRDLRAFIEEHHGGAANRKRLMLLEGGLEFQQMQAAFADMEFAKLKTMSRADICAGFGLDPAAIGYPPEGGRFEYVKEAKADAWLSVVLPRAMWIAGQLDRGVINRFDSDRSYVGHESIRDARPMTRTERLRAVRNVRASRPGRLYAWFDSSGVDAATQLMIGRIEAAEKMVRTLKATPEEASDQLDLGLEGNDAQKVVWVSTTEMPYDMLAAAAEAPRGDEIDEPAVEPTDTPVDDDTDEARHVEAVRRELNQAQLMQLWQGWWMSWSPLRVSMEKTAREHFGALGAQVIANAERINPGRAEGELVEVSLDVPLVDDDYRTIGVERRTWRMTPVQRDVIGEILFDLAAANSRLLVSVRPLIRAATQLGGDQSMREAAAAEGTKPEPFALTDPNVERAMRAREPRIAGTNLTFRRRLAATIADGLSQNETTGELITRIRKETNYARARAATIARTEVGGAVEEARQLGREQADVPGKSWLWSRKETGRENHMETEQITLDRPVPNHQRFTIAQTGNTCMHPRATGDPQDDVNCGCTTIARYPGDQVRDLRVIRYLKANGFAAITKESESWN